MRIDSVELVHVRVPLKEPFRISTAEVSEKDAVLCIISSGETKGIGECSPMSGSFYNDETPETCIAALRSTLVPALLKEDLASPHDFDRIASLIPGDMFAKAGLEMGLWDLFGRASGQPIYRMLGASGAPVQSGLAVGIYDTVKDLLDRIEAHLKDGYVRVKVKVKPGWDEEPLKAIRKKFGGIELMVDANAAYTIEHLEDLKKLDKFSLMMIEQPLGADALEDSARLQAHLRTPICIDESADSLASVERAVKLGAASIVNIKLQRVGGFGPALKMHDYCLANKIPVWCGYMPELGISTAAGLHISGLPGYIYPGDLEPSLRWFTDDITEEPIALSEPGYIDVPQGPGLGINLDMAKVEKYKVWSELLQG